MVKTKQQSSKIPSVGDEAYVYDKNGNMIEDKYKKIQITYNYLNLPLQITYKENNFIHFVYSATGEKLQKIVTVEGKVQSKTDYINGIEYKNDVLQRIAHTEGSLSRQDDDKFLQEYVLRDHLGNTRVTFTDADNDGVVNEKDIKQINNFYPFGLNMEGNWNGAAGSNKYQYNGKEWNDDFGLGWNDYGARMYDPAMARWVTVDPLAEKMRRHSPYNYAFDNPTRFVDPDGREPQKKEGPGDKIKTSTVMIVNNQTNATIAKVSIYAMVNKKGEVISMDAKVANGLSKKDDNLIVTVSASAKNGTGVLSVDVKTREISGQKIETVSKDKTQGSGAEGSGTIPTPTIPVSVKLSTNESERNGTASSTSETSDRQAQSGAILNIGVAKNGNLQALNQSTEGSDIRFGGNFANQDKGEFKTTTSKQ